MNVRRLTCLGLALAAIVTVPAFAEVNDVWLTTKAKMALLTAEGVSVTDVNVYTVDGAVTLHGKVKTDAEKEKATLAVRSVDGVKSVRNRLQVVPDDPKSPLKASDEAIKAAVATALKSTKLAEGVTVDSVNNGVVLLSGKVSSLAEKAHAIELAWKVDGVSRVASEIQADTRD